MEDFSDIRPYLPEELPQVYEQLLADPEFEVAVKHVMPDMDMGELAQALSQCRTNLEVQKTLFYPLVQMIMMRFANGADMDASAVPDREHGRYTFVSNHRDIVLDPAFLSFLLVENGFPTTVEIAIGDNLLIRPWIQHLVRVSKCFIVQRSLSMRQMLLASAKMSRYMHYAVNEKGENVWIAQREGRAKDSDDRTQDSILKMMAMGGEGSVIDRLKHLHIVPMALSYEYDPCDYLKACEFQLKRDIEGWKKSQQDDLKNMQTGIFGRKGHVHFHMAPCIDQWLDTLPADTPKTEVFTIIAQHIDEQIHASYRLYPCNLIAMDRILGTHTEGYTEADVQAFDAYIDAQLEKVKAEPCVTSGEIVPDWDFMRERMLTMYANPAINHFKATKKY